MSVRLLEALRLKPGQSVAFVGAGGKSSALGRLATEAAGAMPVVLTTTTRLGAAQAGLAKAHLIVEQAEDLAALPALLARHGSVVVTGAAKGEAGKWHGPPPDLMDRLYHLAMEAGAALIIEADGARGRGLKAPAEHEPVVPPFTDLVVPVAALDVVGKPLGPEHVHRPERVAALLGKSQGDLLTAEDLGRVLGAAQGGLKGLPPAAEVRALLNRAEGEAALAVGDEVAGRLLGVPRVRAVVLAALRREPPVARVYGRVAGVVLAAGGSSRLGRPKQLVTWRDKPLVRHAVDTALAAGLTPVAVVLGAAAEAVAAALAGAPVRKVVNPAWEAGQSTSVRAGLQAVAAEAEAAVFLLADMPFIPPDLVRALVQVHRETLGPIVAPRAGGRWANPVLFDRVTFDDLMALEGDRGGRALFGRYRVREVPWEESITFDLDTPEDLARLRAE